VLALGRGGALISRRSTHGEGKLVGLFEPSTEIIRRRQQAHRVRHDGEVADAENRISPITRRPLSGHVIQIC
jgi:hypothetical protein